MGNFSEPHNGFFWNEHQRKIIKFLWIPNFQFEPTFASECPWLKFNICTNKEILSTRTEAKKLSSCFIYCIWFWNFMNTALLQWAVLGTFTNTTLFARFLTLTIWLLHFYPCILHTICQESALLNSSTRAILSAMEGACRILSKTKYTPATTTAYILKRLVATIVRASSQ